MTNDVKIRIKLIDQASSGLAKLEQKIRELQQKTAAQAKKLAQEAANAANQSNQQQLSGFQKFAQRERELRQRAADEAKRLAQEVANAANQSNQQQLSGFQKFAQRERELRQRAADEAKRLAQETANAAEHALRQEQDAAKRAFQQIADARKRLGTRAHADINSDMEKARAAYQHLSQSGVSSFREQAQAADKLRHHLTQLTNEMGNLTAAQKRYGALQTGAGIAGGVIGGVAGAAYATVQPIKDAMQYDDRLTNMTNVGFSERDLAGRREGKKEIQGVIENAVKDSRGLVDTFGAAQMLDQLLAGGRVPIKQAMGMLPYLTQTAGANAADPLDIARTTNAAYGLKIVKSNDDLQKFWNMSVTAGQSSSFELKDQVKFLPEQLAFAINNGSHGLNAAAEVLKLNVTSSGVTGNSDEAGVATTNFLRKQTAPDTNKDYADFMEEKHKIKGANLRDEVDNVLANGGNASQLWADFMKRETDASPDVIKLKKKLAKETDPEQRASLESRIRSRTGEIVDQLFQDIRASKGVVGSLNTEYGNAVEAKIKAAQAGTFDPNKGNIDFKHDQVTAKTTELGNTLDIQKHHALQQSFDTLGSTSQKANALAGEHSTLATLAAFRTEIGMGLGGVVGGGMALRYAVKTLMPTAAAEAGAGASVAPTLAANASVAMLRFSGMVTDLTAKAGVLLARAPSLSASIAPVARASMPLVRTLPVVGQLAGAGITGYQAGDFANPYINKAVSKIQGKPATLGTAAYDFTRSGVPNIIKQFSLIAKMAINPIGALGVSGSFFARDTGKSTVRDRVAKESTVSKVSTASTKEGKEGGASSSFNALNSVIAKLSGSESSMSTAVSNLMTWQPKPLPVEVNTQSHLTVSLAAGLVAQAQSSQSNSTAQKGANTSTVNTGSDKGNIFHGAP